MAVALSVRLRVGTKVDDPEAVAEGNEVPLGVADAEREADLLGDDVVVAVVEQQQGCL